MTEVINYWPLLGILVIVIGFLLRLNAALVVLVAGIVTGLLAALPMGDILTKLGEGFVKTRTLALIIILPLPIIGLLERNGLKEHAQNWVARIKSATSGRLLIVYLFIRELTAAIGLTSLGGHPQMVRPLVVPMAEGAFVNRFGSLPKAVSNKLRAMSAATDNVGLFFGEDIFVAFGSIVLMQTFMKTTANLDVDPLHIAVWGIPTAICAFLIHATRLYRLDSQLQRMASTVPVATPNTLPNDTTTTRD
ncbi:DUF969 domain-containing protein [Moraxella atlantae]|uniref:Protein of uncharacterized function (DUF969) n=1 Tax=Faucicola atlantae TaxID=34059 RepID=A0A378Q4E9_9GAMM|nr:DUF969 domain-containing protein [Moraxella atlantae]OPH33293.1 hypothetical protein B5J92_10450 [Moraxella atlantae]STY95681.1 Protein of uncharacterised function (DUF969) [Moraxella atlantae]